MYEILIFMIIGYGFGTYREKRHYKSIKKREKRFLKKPVVTFDKIDNSKNITWAKLVTGNVVVSTDYFKRFIAGLKLFFGGSISSYESLVDRARREAILRLLEESGDADKILNLRIETSTIGNSANKKGGVASIEALAYGTAVKYA